MPLLKLNTELHNGEIHPEISIDEVRQKVMDGNIVILKSVFSEEDLLALRSAVFEWGQASEPSCYDRPMNTIFDVNFHRIDDQPHMSKVPHFYHCFVFNLPHELDSPLKDKALKFIEPLRVFQNRITGNDAQLSPHDQPEKIRPELIQYPVGGGYFEHHDHQLDPQKIGMIMSVSRKGVDYQQGGTTFFIGDEVINTDGEHDIGDITLFRYDIPHEVNAVDEDEEVNWQSDRGRWTMIMPYHA